MGQQISSLNNGFLLVIIILPKPIVMYDILFII